ncbi:hypothetical protein [Streptomyces griseoluteus]|uniref:hypothetical protein n=1 Tax=Streptomyces griseoluteus TaxID=29306 RepID=UPI003698131B
MLIRRYVAPAMKAAVLLDEAAASAETWMQARARRVDVRVDAVVEPPLDQSR